MSYPLKIQREAFTMKTITTSTTKKTTTTNAVTLTPAQKAAATRAAKKAAAAVPPAVTVATPIAAAVAVATPATALNRQAAQDAQLAEFLARTGKTEADIQVSGALDTVDASKVYHLHGYSQVTEDGGKSGGFFRSLTIAAHVYAGYIEMKGALPVSTGKGNFAMLKLLLADSAPAYWKKLGAYTDNLKGMTAIGINKISDSLNTDKGSELRAQPKIINAMIEGFSKGGIRIIEGRKLQFYGVSKAALTKANK